MPERKITIIYDGNDVRMTVDKNMDPEAIMDILVYAKASIGIGTVDVVNVNAFIEELKVKDKKSFATILLKHMTDKSREAFEAYEKSCEKEGCDV